MLGSTMLMISDEPSLIDSVREVARSINNLKLAVLPAIDEAYAYESWNNVALVLIHLKGPGLSADVARLLRMISAARRPVATLVIGEQADDDQSLALLRMGVADYLTCPVDLAWLSHLVSVLTVRARQNSLSTIPETPRRSEPDFQDLIFDDESREPDELMSQVRRVAPQDTTILLSGETGTGKTRLAHLIHELSPRRTEPFVVINCGAVPASQIESEMFGHVRGTFNAQEPDRVGQFAKVGRGTLFLDEIDSLPLTVQAKLLRVVEDRVFEPVGSNKSLPVRARLIASSNQMLDQEVAAERFRSDLYYRINVIGFHLPPLRERRRAIPALVNTFLQEFATRDGVEVASISDEALKALERYDWPGNVRELRNLIERSVALCHGREIRVEDLPNSVVRSRYPSIGNDELPQSILRIPHVAHTTLAEIKREAELTRITEALEKHSNNRLRAASELGISRMTLYKKLYKYGLMHSNAAP